MIKMNDRVCVGSRIGADPAMAVVVDIIPANDYRQAMYRVRFDVPTNKDGRRSEIGGCVTITPHPNECWIDEDLILVNYSTGSTSTAPIPKDKDFVRITHSGKDYCGQVISADDTDRGYMVKVKLDWNGTRKADEEEYAIFRLGQCDSYKVFES